jgi:hypothetical protein
LVAALPALAVVIGGRWLVLAVSLPVWALPVALVSVAVRGRSATGRVMPWCFRLGGAMGWTRRQSKAVVWVAGDLGEVDLPGVLAGIQIHDGPPLGPRDDQGRARAEPLGAYGGRFRGVTQ